MDDVNFYVHGVPKGHDIWGIEQDRDYLKSFYTARCTDEIRLDVLRGKSFYTYIRGKNVSGFDDRKGSYLGLTISFDSVFCTDTESLCRLFEIVFERLIVGTILNEHNGNYRYSVSTFSSKTKELEKVKSVLFRELEQFNDDFESIDNSFAALPSKQPTYYNLLDVDSPTFFSTLKRTLKICISHDYTTRDNYIASLKNQLDSVKTENNKLADENSTLKVQVAELSKLKEQIESLSAENKKLRQDNALLQGKNADLLRDIEKYKPKQVPVLATDDPETEHIPYKEKRVDKNNKIMKNNSAHKKNKQNQNKSNHKKKKK